MKQKIRIAAGQGFWGDLPGAPVRQEDLPKSLVRLRYVFSVSSGALDYSHKRKISRKGAKLKRKRPQRKLRIFFAAYLFNSAPLRETISASRRGTWTGVRRGAWRWLAR